MQIETATPIQIKGNKNGLLIKLADEVGRDWLGKMTTAVSEKQAFWSGSRVTLDVGERLLVKQEVQQLVSLFEQRQLTLWTVLAKTAETRRAARACGLATRLPGSLTDLEGNRLASPAHTPVHTKELPYANALMLNETIRSGRSIIHDGHVVILGDVNAGAEVVAGGNVMVWGRVRGLVHAGAFGDETAVICALHLAPTQLRIANHIAVSPQDDQRKQPLPEIAIVRDGQIVAEAWRS